MALTADAEKEYGAALRLKPKLVSALSNLGVLFARTNRTTEAIAKFEEVLRIDPKLIDEKAIFNLGALYAASGDYKRAVPLPGKSRRPDALSCRDVWKRRAQTTRGTFYLALSLAEAHEYAEAVRLFQRTNELRPQTYEVLYNLGLALYNLDRLDEAQQAMSSAVGVETGRSGALLPSRFDRVCAGRHESGADALDQSARTAACVC